MLDGKDQQDYGDTMTNIITTVRKAVAPIKTTGRALGIFATALASLEEVKQYQFSRQQAAEEEALHNRTIIAGLYQKNEALYDEAANALIEVETAQVAIEKITALWTPSAVAA